MPNEISVGDLVALLKLDKTQYDAAMVAAGKTTQEHSNKIVDWLKKVSLGFAAAFSVKAVIAFVSSSVKEYFKAEEALAKMNSALRATGGYSSASSRALSDLAGSLQEVTKFEEEASKEAMGLMMSLGGMTSKMAGEALPVLQDFATGMGIDLQSAAMVFSKAMEGNVGALGRYGIKVQEGLKGDELMVAILDQMREKFGGLAKVMGDTASGAITRMNNALGEIKEELGRAVANGLKPFAEWLATVAKNISGAMKAANDLKVSLAAQAKGIADTNDKLVIATAKYDELRYALGMATGEIGGHNAALQAQDNLRKSGFKSMDDYVKWLKVQIVESRTAREGVEDMAKREREQADALAAAAKAAADHAQAVADAYAKTAPGIRAAMLEQIDYWEKTLDAAGADAPKVQAILDDLVKKYEEQYGVYDKTAAALGDLARRYKALGDAAEAMADKFAASQGDTATRWEAIGQAALQAAADEEFHFELAEEPADKFEAAQRDMAARWGAVGQAAKGAADESLTAFLESFNSIIAKARMVFGDLQSVVDQYFENVNTSIQNSLQIRLNAIEAEETALDKQLSADLKRIDAELRAALKAAGVEEKTERQRLEAELKAAIATGNAENIKEAQDALTRYDITKKYEDEKVRLAEEAAAKKQALEDARAAAEKEFENEKNRIALQQFRVNKAAKLIEIAINTAVEVSKVLANPVLAVIVAAIGAVQAGLVLAQPEPVFPTYRQGGVVGMEAGGVLQGQPGIDANLIRASAGEYIMPTEQTAANIGILEAIRKGASGEAIVTVNPGLVIVQLDGREIARAQVPYLAEESDKGNFRVNPKAVRAKS